MCVVSKTITLRSVEHALSHGKGKFMSDIPRAVYDELTAQYVALQDQYSYLENANAQLHRKVSDLEYERDELERKVRELEWDLDRYKREVDTLTRDISDLEYRLASAERESHGYW